MYRDSLNLIALVLATTITTVCLTGCIELEMDTDPRAAVDSTHDSLYGANGLSPNGLPNNGLPNNGLPNNGLPNNGLPNNGLPNNGLPNNGLPNNGLPNNGLPTAGISADWNRWLNDDTDVDGVPRKVRNRMLMKYLVRCALTPDATVGFEDDQGNLFEWNGGVGVAPEWETGSITASQQRWISACVASLVNSASVSVVVSQRGPRNSAIDAMVPGEEADYSEVEGAYFGNLFAATPALYSCRGPAYTTAVNPGRNCTIANGNCPPLTQVGNCEDICSVETRTVDDVTFDVYHDCDPDGAGGQSSFAEVTTIFLNPNNG